MQRLGFTTCLFNAKCIKEGLWQTLWGLAKRVQCSSMSALHRQKWVAHAAMEMQGHFFGCITALISLSIFYIYVIPKLKSSCMLGQSYLQLVSYRPPRMLARSMSFVWLNSCTLILMMHKPFAYSRKNKSSKYNGHFDGILCILINLDCYALYLGNEECNLFCST